MINNRTTYSVVAAVCSAALGGIVASHEIIIPPIPPGGPLPHLNECGVPTMGDVLHICEIEPLADGSTILIFEKRFSNLFALLESEHDGQLVGVDAWWSLEDVGDMAQVVSFPMNGRVPLLEGEDWGQSVANTYGFVAIRYVGKLIDIDDMVYWIDTGAQ